jgi:FAD-dependent urate hydroxylase
MRVLIVGGGVAGLTLGAKLLQQGVVPVIVEKAQVYSDIGYGLGLYPLGSCVLHGLGIFDTFVEKGQATTMYEVADHGGVVLQSADMATFTADAGPMEMISRSDLIELLVRAARGADFRMGTTVSKIRQEDPSLHSVAVDFDDGQSEVFDLVVGADGMHSQVRELVFGQQQLIDTGWLLWTWWAEMPNWPPETIREYWGAGNFFGIYPCKDKIMCAGGMPAKAATVDAGDTEAARKLLQAQHAPLIATDARIGQALDSASSFFPWPMVDVKSDEWVRGRVTLVGDAAVGFLPTAGVGASNAMRGAAALADELSRAGRATIPLALRLYEKRARKIIEGNQQDSRSVAKYMFVDGRATAWGRDQLMKHYPAERIVKQIVKSMETPF